MTHIFGLIKDTFLNLQHNMLKPIDEDEKYDSEDEAEGEDDDDALAAKYRSDDGGWFAKGERSVKRVKGEWQEKMQAYRLAVAVVQRGFVQYCTIHYGLLQ
eukprot:4352696-Pyramimonas_sp.AAC.1